MEHNYDDGWALCKNTRTNAVGLLPRNFLTETTPADYGGVTPANASYKNIEGVKNEDVVKSKRVSSLIMPNGNSGGGWMTGMKEKLDNINLDQRSAPGAAKPEKPKVVDIKNTGPMVAANIGALSFAVLGDTAIGKTSFVQAFMNIPERSRICEDVLEKPTPNMDTYKFSTVPESQLFTGEIAHNITIFDTVGYSSCPNAADTIRPAVDHLQRQFENTDKVFVPGLPIPNLAKFLNSGTGKRIFWVTSRFAYVH